LVHLSPAKVSIRNGKARPAKLEPPLDPETNQPMSPEKLKAIFPESLLEQEMSTER